MPTVDGVDLPPGWGLIRTVVGRSQSTVGYMSYQFAAMPADSGYVLVPVRKGVIYRRECDGLVYPTLMAAIMAAELQKGDASEQRVV